MAACLAAGPAAVASHESAAWLWDLVEAPDHPSITVPRGTFRSRPQRRVIVHRPLDFPTHVLVRRGIPTTNPLRTLVDLAAVTGPDHLDDAVDRALARRLVTATGIEAEVDRLGRNGRRGAGVMRAALKRRGFAGAPSPSVLESRLLRLLRQGGIEPIGTEVWIGPENRYRIDTMLAKEVVVEVDGYAYHNSPEQVTEDKRRRQRLRLCGLTVMEYTWIDVVLDGRRVLAEARQALSRG
jgi:very-short-patch-repair endonuclease